MNLVPLKRHAHEERAASSGERRFVVAMVLVLTAIAAIPLVIAGSLIAVAGRILF